MDWTAILLPLLTGGVGAILGNWAAIIRARGQNRTDEIGTVTKQQEAFVLSLMNELNAIRKDNDGLRASSHMLRSDIAALEGTVKAVLNQLDLKAQEMAELEIQMKQLEDENGLYRRTFREHGIEIPQDQRKRDR